MMCTIGDDVGLCRTPRAIIEAPLVDWIEREQPTMTR